MPLELIGDAIDKLLSVLTFKLFNVPLVDNDRVGAPEFTMRALPVVLNVRLGVDVLMLDAPMFPEPEVIVIDVLPVSSDDN